MKAYTKNGKENNALNLLMDNNKKCAGLYTLILTWL